MPTGYLAGLDPPTPMPRARPNVFDQFDDDWVPVSSAQLPPGFELDDWQPVGTASQASGNSLVSFTADAPPEAYLGIDNNLCCRTLPRRLGSWRHQCSPDT
jgi:hypothetical protein